MKIGIVHPYPVFDGAVGGVTRVYSLARFLADRHEVKVFTHSSGCVRTDAEAVENLAEIGVDQSIFKLQNPGTLRRLAWTVGNDPYFVSFNRNPELEAALVDQDESGPFDVVHVEFAYLAPLLGGLGPRTVRVLAEQETMSEAVARLRRLPPWKKSLYEHFLGTQGPKVRRFEAAALASFSRVFAISSEEADVMAEVSDREVEILPHVVNTRKFTPGDSSRSESTVLFVGNYRHRPNLHGLLWFIDEVWPRVCATRPEAVFEIVGPGLEGDDLNRVRSKGVRVMGRVEDLVARYRNASVFVNPILSGGGMRGKVLESFACGLPVVSTQMGMEGIAAGEGTHYLEADDPEGFASRVGMYLDDPDMRSRHADLARALVQELYDTREVFARLENDYRLCVERTIRSCEKNDR